MIEDIAINDNKNPIEKFANFDGNETILLCERINNPEIKRQLVSTIREYIETKNLPSRVQKSDAHGKLADIPVSEIENERKKEIEQVEENLDESIKRAFSVANIEFSKGLDNAETMFMYSENPNTEKKFIELINTLGI